MPPKDPFKRVPEEEGGVDIAVRNPGSPNDSESSNVALEPEGLRGKPQKEAEERLFLGWLFGRLG